MDRASLVSEKIHGKRPAVDEPARKRRKTADTASYKPGGISLGDDQATRPRRTTVLEWSNDDEDLIARPPSMKEPPLRAEVPV